MSMVTLCPSSNKEGVCLICREGYSPNEPSSAHEAGETEHFYHDKCLRVWIRLGKQNECCLLCKVPFDQKSIEHLKPSWKEAALYHLEGICGIPSRSIYWGGLRWSIEQALSGEAFRVDTLFNHIKTSMSLSYAAPLIKRGAGWLLDRHPAILIAGFPITGSALHVICLYAQGAFANSPLLRLLNLRDCLKIASWIPCLIFPHKYSLDLAFGKELEGAVHISNSMYRKSISIFALSLIGQIVNYTRYTEIT